MAKRLIGTGTTDSNGTATIQYTGTGAGKIDIVAEYTDGESIIQSETYETIDGIFLDRAVSGQKNTDWTNPSSNIQEVTDDNGTLLTNSNTSAMHYWANNYTQFNTGFAVEFDLHSYSDSATVGVRLLGTSSHILYFKSINCPQSCHLKIICDGTSVKYQIDNGDIVNWLTTDNSNFYVGFRFNGQYSIKYSNFVVYPI